MQDRDQYVYFTIKLLKGSFALNALWQDALNYHMIDQPDKLIAMRLTEYYELVARGALRPGPSMLGIAPSPTPSLAANNVPPPSPPVNNGKFPDPQTRIDSTPQPVLAGEAVTSAPSSVVEQNADDAADYWAPL